MEKAYSLLRFGLAEVGLLGAGSQASGEASHDGFDDLPRRRAASDVGGPNRRFGEYRGHGVLDQEPCPARVLVVPGPGQVLQQHGTREDRRHRIGDAFAGDVRGRAVAGLKDRVAVAQVGGRGHAQPADQPGRQVREDVAEHVLGDDHVEPLRLADELEGRRVDVQVIGRDVRIARGDLVEHGAEEGERAEHVGLVHAGHARPGFAAAAGQLEGRADDPRGAAAGDDLGIGGDLIAEHDARAQRGEEPLGALADDDQVDGGDTRQGTRNTRQPPCGANPRVQVELAAEGDLRGQLRAVLAADVGQSAGAQEDRVGLAAGRQRRGGEILSALEVSPLRRPGPAGTRGRSRPRAAGPRSARRSHRPRPRGRCRPLPQPRSCTSSSISTHPNAPPPRPVAACV